MVLRGECPSLAFFFFLNHSADSTMIKTMFITYNMGFTY